MPRSFSMTRRLRRTVFLLCLFLLPFASGCTAIPTRGQQVWRSLIDYDYPGHPVGSPEFEESLDRFTGSVSRPDSPALLLQNGDEAYPAMLALIAGARRRISLETYIVEKDAATDRFFDALKEAASRGVEVRILVDAAGFGRGTVAQLSELIRHGIQARVFNPLFLSWTIIRANNRDHRKILVADGRHAILGGINLSDRQRGNGVTGWRDTSLLVSGPAAVDAECVFAETWEQAGRGWLGRNLPLTVLNPVKRVVDEPFLRLGESIRGRPRFLPPPYSPPGDDEPPLPGFIDYHTRSASVRVVSSSPDRRSSPTYDLAILGILGARERVDIACAYFVPPLNLRRALVRAAERGVRVRLLLPGVTDVKWVREIGMRFYGDLLRAGVRIYEWPYPILHSKTMVVDDRWLVAGSANMDSRSYFLNYEANLVASDPALAEEAHRTFEKDLLIARELTLEAWECRDSGQQALETLLIPVAGQY